MGLEARHIVVVGAGIVGAATALALVERGARVTVLERASPGSAVSGASLACLGTHMNSEIELPQLIWATQRWALWDQRFHGAFHYRRCGQIRFIDHEADIPTTERWIALERAAGLSASFLTAAQVREIEPALTGSILAASWSPDDALVNPFLSVRTLLRAAMDAGAQLRHHQSVLAIDTRGERVCGVRTADATIPADAVVVAGGPWAADLVAPLGVSLPIVPRKAQCLATVAQPPTIRGVVGACKSEQGGVHGGYTQIQQSEAGQILFNTVLEGGESAPGAQNAIPQVDLRFVSDSITTLLRLFPGLRGIDVLRSWVRFEAVTPDDRFIAGPIGPTGLYMAAGDNGTGFLRAPVIAEIITAALEARSGEVDPTPYDPQRFSAGRETFA
ncbi:NAD(P)/FAD-dependent oxidoreductase [Ancylobacter sp. G4_0304]|uniref:NAD(P)/FAD-dependent oxidoreductase n=1 Tax=Ancylobacter sp. G4_0304 TaxID=3114289 RepID=UPI0039C68843